MNNIYYAMDSKGAFIAGDSITGITAYAYPTSEYADDAKKNPARVAQEMINGELNWSRPKELAKPYDERNWKLIHDLTADHTVKAIIDSVSERA